MALPCDFSASIRIAMWVYQQTERANGQVWVVEKVLEHLRPAWSQCIHVNGGAGKSPKESVR